MRWKEIKEFMDKQLDDGDEIEVIHALCKGDSMDVTIGYEGAILGEPEQKVTSFPLNVSVN